MPGYWFHDFWDKLPEAKNYSGNAPRVHDFRHTFAVNRLTQWVHEGKDVNACLPYLSMYLGHQNFADTDYYLHLTPEFFPVLKEKSKAIFGDIIPEAIYEQEI
jgi:integrase